MAKRRRRFRREAPDRGWFVDQQEMTFTVGASQTVVNVVEILPFQAITDVDVLTQDKSDWFIKRVLLDVYPVINRAVDTSAPARLYEFALGTIDDRVALEWDLSVLDDSNVISDSSYDNWRRLFRSYSRPVYSTLWSVTGANGALITTTTTPGTDNGVADSPWGPSAIHDDFEVSNAGLVPESSMYAAISTGPDGQGPSTYDWANGDVLTARVITRTLLQKRRNA